MMLRRVLATAPSTAVPVAHSTVLLPMPEGIATDTHDIRGNTPQRRAAAIGEDGPMAPWGRRVFGYTTVGIHWWLRILAAGNRCRLANADVRRNAPHAAPRGVDAVAGFVKLRRRWPAFVDALAAHEALDLQRVRETADRMRTPSGGRPGCDMQGAGSAADEAAVREVREGATRNRELDARTGHGRTEGVDLGS